jgi:hypothetical protein
MSSRRGLPLAYVPSDKVGRLYWRDLPGGGYVVLDVADEPRQAGGRFVGRITVERRSDGARRAGGAPPVIAEVRGPSSGMLLHQLLPIARSNPAIGAALLHLRPVTRDQ